MQAILTKYHGPSNVKGSRLSATGDQVWVFADADDSTAHVICRLTSRAEKAA